MNATPRVQLGARTARKDLPATLDIKVNLTRCGGWTPSGLVACTYEESLEGRAEVISRTHLYLWRRGIDLYPTTEQYQALAAGETVTLGMQQWA